jgi:hypothetical protein
MPDKQQISTETLSPGRSVALCVAATVKFLAWYVAALGPLTLAGLQQQGHHLVLQTPPAPPAVKLIPVSSADVEFWVLLLWVRRRCRHQHRWLAVCCFDECSPAKQKVTASTPQVRSQAEARLKGLGFGVVLDGYRMQQAGSMPSWIQRMSSMLETTHLMPCMRLVWVQCPSTWQEGSC